jgi:hypothetical protein
MELDGIGHAAVEEFWRRCGQPEPFPRNLERSIALALPIFLVKVPRLCLSAACTWLCARGFEAESAFLAGSERPLRGCLVAAAGRGVIFLDGSDPDDQRRFTLAHEVAHFLVDYYLPRRAALERLGPHLAEVLDGQRPPTAEERLGALLARAPLQTYVNLLGRGDGGDTLHADLDEIETRADRVGLELLAPENEVWLRADVSAPTFDAREARLSATLVGCFGLPSSTARSYARTLLLHAGKGPSWAERLRS